MRKCLVTGANGFVGRNLCVHLENMQDVEVIRFDINNTNNELHEFCKDADFIFHFAGINRPKREDEFEKGNVSLTVEIISILEDAGKKTPILVSSSTQAVLDNPYGISKKHAEDIVLEYGKNAPIYIYRFPNLFGKWCKPNYNSVVATFCYNIAHDIPIQINDEDHLLTLCYIDDVVRECIKALEGKKKSASDGFCRVSTTYQVTLGELAEKLYTYHDIRKTGVLPDMNDSFTRVLYSTYLSYLEEDHFSYFPTLHSDERGWLFELIKQPSFGQIFVSVTKKGVTRGNHYHHTKVEKFTVVQGEAIIRFRKINSEKVLEYKVFGEKPEIVDIPPGYTHHIENIGDTDVLTLFWACEMFNPENPDTIYLKV
ncbi:MAG: NAD-dependent epimerase/dehydratase family protein [Clostridiales bacterium]|nr:NAD-dependent epimerase/dehydratase family protein [Clostridiales bacterium]